SSPTRAQDKASERLKLAHFKGRRLMSAFGQKQTCAAQNVMSALLPIATEKADFRKRSCPLYPRKQTYAVQLGMSALGQKRTSGTIMSVQGARRLRAARPL